MLPCPLSSCSGYITKNSPLPLPSDSDFQQANNCLFLPIYIKYKFLNWKPKCFLKENCHAILLIPKIHVFLNSCPMSNSHMFPNSHLKQSMWTAGLALYSPWLSFWKPISKDMSRLCIAARVSTNGLQSSPLNVQICTIKQNQSDHSGFMEIHQKVNTNQSCLHYKLQISGASLLVCGQRIASADSPVKQKTITILLGLKIIQFLLLTAKDNAREYPDLIWFIKHCKWSLELWTRSILKILHILGNNLSVANQESLQRIPMC